MNKLCKRFQWTPHAVAASKIAFYQWTSKINHRRHTSAYDPPNWHTTIPCSRVPMTSQLFLVICWRILRLHSKHNKVHAKVWQRDSCRDWTKSPNHFAFNAERTNKNIRLAHTTSLCTKTGGSTRRDVHRAKIFVAHHNSIRMSYSPRNCFATFPEGGKGSACENKDDFCTRRVFVQLIYLSSRSIAFANVYAVPKRLSCIVYRVTPVLLANSSVVVSTGTHLS